MFASINKRLKVIEFPANVRLGYVMEMLDVANAAKFTNCNVKILIVHADGRIVKVKLYLAFRLNVRVLVNL